MTGLRVALAVAALVVLGVRVAVRRHGRWLRDLIAPPPAEFRRKP